MTDEPATFDENYPTRRLLELIGDKWTPIVLFILGHGRKRYSELQRHLPDISRKMLTQTLRTLEGDGLLTRTAIDSVPPRVDYDLTPLGRTFLEPVTLMCRWASENPDALGKIASDRKKSARRKRLPRERM
jgi:DNA-binding HxlR family transcriptional regulator